MPSGNLNSGRSCDTDDLRVRPLKVISLLCITNFLSLPSHHKDMTPNVSKDSGQTKTALNIGQKLKETEKL
jgi:hypothetical protein